MPRNEPDDIDALLAEVERSLSPGAAAPAATPARRPSSSPSPSRSGRGQAADTDKGEASDRTLVEQLTRRLSIALVAGGVSAALVFVAFFLTPLTGAISGALGAAIAGFLTALVLPHRV